MSIERNTCVYMTVSLDEGNRLPLGCLFCNETVVAHLAIAYPGTAYIVSLNCSQCSRQLAEYDEFSLVVPASSFNPFGSTKASSYEVTAMADQRGAGRPAFEGDADYWTAVTQQRRKGSPVTRARRIRR
jgi:hypothetical protein